MITRENGIFICYRREDASSAAYIIDRRLRDAFGERAVSVDYRGFKSGNEWRVDTQAILKCAVAVVVIIDNQWLSIGKKRFKDPDDPVRRELELAL
ncbi:MAG: TIR domain-containing protein, partial [Bacteroidetes bacterium]|nr:TIR domain-containing protein [Bacteroidota bacterium]